MIVAWKVPGSSPVWGALTTPRQNIDWILKDEFEINAIKTINGLKFFGNWGYPPVDLENATLLTLGTRIIALRIQKGLNQENLAKYSGIATSVIARYEQDRILDINPEILQKIAEILQVDPVLLLPTRIQPESGQFAEFFSPYVSSGSKIRQFRIDRGIQQKDLAEALGVSRETIRRYEKNHSKPTKKIIAKLEEYMRLF
jgi:transcriptional regulator with XRE-family HTH domain